MSRTAKVTALICWIISVGLPLPPAIGIIPAEVRMRFEKFSFGSIRIDGTTYGHDVVIDRGEVRKRKKKPSKTFRDAFGHTPLSTEEEIPWRCRRLVIGTGTGALPVMKDVKQEAKRLKIELLVLPTTKAIAAKNNLNPRRALVVFLWLAAYSLAQPAAPSSSSSSTNIFAPASTPADLIDGLSRFVLGVSAVIFAAVFGLLL